MKMRLEVKKGIIRTLLSMLVVMCVLAGSEGICNEIEVLAASVRPDRINPGVEFYITESDATVSAPNAWYVFFCLYGDDANFFSDVGNRMETRSAVDKRQATSRSQTTPSSINGISPEEWRLVKYDHRSSGAWGADYILVYQAQFVKDVTYHPNGGDLPGAAVKTIYDSHDIEFGNSGDKYSLTLRGSDTYVRSGYKLVGWSHSTSGSKEYDAGETLQLGTSDLQGELLYAVWEEKAAANLSISVPATVYEGQDLNIAVTTNTSGGTVTYEYKAQGAEDSAYSSTRPTAPGSYTVRATSAETADYKSAEDTADFEILVASVDVDVKYNPNGGNGTAFNQVKNVDLTSGDGSITLLNLAESGFSRENYKFNGWKEKNDAAGTVRAAGSSYNGITSATASLEFDAIWERKAAGRIGISVETPYYEDQTLAVTVTENNSGGDVTYEYKKKGAADTTYSAAKPKEPGEYTVRAMLAETADYSSAETTADFKILSSKLEVSTTYKPNGGTGTTISENKTITMTAGTGEIILLSSADFKRTGYNLTGWKDQNGKTYSLGAKYEVSNSNHEPVFNAVWTAKKAGTVDIDIKTPAYVGAKLKYDVDKNSEGDVTVEYKKKGGKDSEYSKKVPTEPGEYTVRVKLEETDEYTMAEDTDDFKIVYLDAPATPYTYQEVKNSKGTVTDLTIVPASGYSLSTSVKASTASTMLYSSVGQGGSVCLKRDSDNATTDLIKLADYIASDNPGISVKDKIYYGTPVEVTVSSLSPAKLTTEYKKSGAADSTYSAAVPTDPGKYTARLTAPASGFYAAVNVTKDFTIAYLEEPSTLASFEGEKGDERWFKSDVKIKAPSGYLICTGLNGVYSESISWNDKITKIYYMRESDGAKTDGITLSEEIKIDKHTPKIEFDSSLGINNPKDSVKIYSDSLSFMLSDENLKYVTVNGTKYPVSDDGKCTVLLEAGVTAEQMTVLAKDEAGNTYTLLIELVPAWMESNVMPLDRDVLLTSSVEYSFEPGKKWMVNGDATVYEGGNKFFVRSSNTYKFNTK